jgi:hypothetical protein
MFQAPCHQASGPRDHVRGIAPPVATARAQLSQCAHESLLLNLVQKKCGVFRVVNECSDYSTLRLRASFSQRATAMIHAISIVLELSELAAVASSATTRLRERSDDRMSSPVTVAA